MLKDSEREEQVVACDWLLHLNKAQRCYLQFQAAGAALKPDFALVHVGDESKGETYCIINIVFEKEYYDSYTKFKIVVDS